MVFIRNRYYSDYGLEFAFGRIVEELALLGESGVVISAPLFGYGLSSKSSAHSSCNSKKPFSCNSEKPFSCNSEKPPSCNLEKAFSCDLEKAFSCDLENQPSSIEIFRDGVVVFWDKDVRLAEFLERKGVLVLPNSALGLAISDDKERCYARLERAGVPLIPTIVAPLVFDVCDGVDGGFLDTVESTLGYPVVVKQNVGSQGKQVYLARNRTELEKLNRQLVHTPHIYQQFFGEYGADIRVYVLDGQALAAVKRTNTTDFKSNVAMGGDMQPYPLSQELEELSVKIAELLCLSFCSVDFLFSDDKLVFLEANSNAYFSGIEKLGIPIAPKLAKFISKKAKEHKTQIQ